MLAFSEVSQGFGEWLFINGGGGVCKGGKLKANMMEIGGTMQTMQGLVDFHEAAWVHKYNGLYYLSYADNHSDATGDNRMCYAAGPTTTPVPAAKYEAENAVLGNGATVGTDGAASGGKCIQNLNSANSFVQFNNVNGGAGGRATITFSTVSRRYIRLSFTANSGATAGQVAEFEVWGTAGPTSTPTPAPI